MKNGSYSVASGYEIAFNFFHLPLEAYLVFYFNKAIWKSIWTLRVPAKIKTLVWKVTHNGVPVKQQLRNRIPTIDDHCPWCLNELESMMHCFVTCSHSKQVWNLLDIPHQSWSHTSSSFWKGWIELVDSLKAAQDR